MKSFSLKNILCLIFISIAAQAQQNPFAGEWINERYVKSIMVYKSPFKAQKVQEMSSVSIPKSSRETIVIGWNLHEGEGAMLKKVGAKYQLIRTESAGKPFTFAYFQSVNKLKIENNYFVKLKAANQESFLNELLFAGKYYAGKKPVNFLMNGKITGLGKMLYYRPAYDFLGGGLQKDVISLSKTPDFKQFTDYLFAFKDKTLTLYTLNCTKIEPKTKECFEAKRGRIVYQLVKE